MQKDRNFSEMNDIFVENEKEHLKKKSDSGEATITNVPVKLVKQTQVHPKVQSVQFNKLAPYLCCEDSKSLIQW